MKPVDCEGIQKLMQNGFSLQDALKLLESKENQTVFAELRWRMENGDDICEFFHLYCPTVYLNYFSGFIRYLSFLDSLSLSMSIVAAEQKQMAELRKGIAYPCMLFLAMLAGVILFNEFCFPPLMSLMAGFHVQNVSYEVTHQIIRVITGILLVLLAAVAAVFLYFRQESNQIKGYRIAVKYLKGSIFCQFASADFIRFFQQCIRRNIKTRQSMQILAGLQHKPLVVHLTRTIEQALLAGETIERAIENPNIDPVLYRFFRIAVYASDMDQMLASYLELCQQRIRRQCRRFTTAVQLISYASIGGILIIVYQILLMPLTLLTQLA